VHQVRQVTERHGGPSPAREAGWDVMQIIKSWLISMALMLLIAVLIAII
jgi:hypothetical protein